MVHEPHVVLDVPSHRLVAIQFGVLHGHLLPADGALPLLFRPHENLEHLALRRRTTLEIGEFLRELATKRPHELCITFGRPLEICHDSLKQRREQLGTLLVSETGTSHLVSNLPVQPWAESSARRQLLRARLEVTCFGISA
jgi:hypothetical protein